MTRVVLGPMFSPVFLRQATYGSSANDYGFLGKLWLGDEVLETEQSPSGRVMAGQ